MILWATRRAPLEEFTPQLYRSTSLEYPPSVYPSRAGPKAGPKRALKSGYLGENGPQRVPALGCLQGLLRRL